MKYQLIKPVVEHYTALEQVLTNRGVPLNNIPKYLQTTDEDIYSYTLFGKQPLQDAAVALVKCIQQDKNALVVVDSDCDGFTSAALLINYLYDLFPAWVNNNLNWFLHTGKQHGLSDLHTYDTSDISLIICPDSSSNDYEEHKKYKEAGIDIIVLDHHEAEYVSDNAIIINNQLSDYPNKEMSGVGVTWQFCRYLDSLLGKNNADEYLDLVALGMDADMMSLLSLETKHLINKGFTQIRNPFFEAMVEKNAYSMKNEVTPIGVAFYVAPYVNAIVRSGTQEEKEIVFRSMLNHKAGEKILSNKRGHKLGEMEYLYVQAMRTVVNVKNRQTRAQDAGMELVEHMIQEQDLLKDKVLMILLYPGDIDRNIAGLVANKLMAKYQRPCCILTRVEEEIKPVLWLEDGNNDKERIWNKDGKTYNRVSYQGSARGCDKAGITNFKDICEETGCIMYAEGHQGAFGLGIELGCLSDFLDRTNEALSDMSNEVIYYVDYIYDGVNVNPQQVLDIGTHTELWGKDVDEPYIAIENLKVTKDMLTLMSPDKKPTLKITLPNKVTLVKFNSSQEEYESLYSELGYIAIDVIGRCNANKFGYSVYPQIIIEDYEKVGQAKYIF